LKRPGDSNMTPVKSMKMDSLNARSPKVFYASLSGMKGKPSFKEFGQDSEVVRNYGLKV
jgi:hypothetical protein